MEIFRFVFSPIEVNTYILADKSGECAVIDCGCYNTDEFSELTGFIDSKKLRPVLLLNTHCHLDHVFGNRFMLKKYNLGALSSREEETNRENAADHAMLFGLSMEVPPSPAGFLGDVQIVSFAQNELRVISVPGHSRGSLAFYSKPEGAV